ncbi:MAG: hypothetical protein RIS47_1465 [Bacteroidota bacterium]|jgi:putative hemolysin
MNQPRRKYWDIKAIIREKSPVGSRFIPWFVIGYIKNKVIHEDGVNDILNKLEGLYGTDWMTKALEILNVTIVVEGEENIPRTGENVFIANHPLGNIDGMAYFSILSRYFKKIRSISNALLQHFPNIDELYVPVDILNERSKESLLGVDRLYREPGQIIHFPAGAVSRDIDGVIKDLPWKKSFVNKSIEYQRTIVPVFIHEQNSKFFYRLSRLRMFLGIKRPIELFYLVDEMFKKRNITLRFTIGTPIPASRLTKDKRPQEWCEIIRAYTYSLATNPDAKF